MNSDLLKNLERFVGFETTPEHNLTSTKCLDWLAEEFLLPGCALDPRRGDVKGAPYLLIDHPQPRLVWLGHVNVSPGRAEQFSLHVEGDRAFGRGVKRMKGGVLAFLDAFRQTCRTEGVPPVSVLIASDEVAIGETVQRLLGSGTLNGPAALTPDNGSSNEIVIQQKGVIWARLLAEVANRPVVTCDADNPNVVLVETINHLRRVFRRDTRKKWRLTVEITHFLAPADGRRLHQVSKTANCDLEIRFPSYLTAAEAIGMVQKELPRDCRMEALYRGAPIDTHPQLPIVKTLERISRNVTQRAVPLGRSHGPSDARFLAEQGIHPVLFGPVGEDECSDSEWLSVESLEHHVEINRQLLLELNSMQ